MYSLQLTSRWAPLGTETPYNPAGSRFLRGAESEIWVWNLARETQGFVHLAHARDTAGGLFSLDAHPLLREYFAKRVRTEQPEAWRAAHRRLYEHLSATTKEGNHPTLDDLQPLYQAVALDCGSTRQGRIMPLR